MENRSKQKSHNSWYAKAQSAIFQNQPVILYHGTLKSQLQNIQKEGLHSGEGWGGANTNGVYLSAKPEGALYWAKIAYMRNKGGRMESERFDRSYGKRQKDLIVVLKITIPASHLSNLKADMEQAEDFQFEGKDEDWQDSLKKIGDVRYEGNIPSSWIEIAR